jgi:hypothetical protein
MTENVDDKREKITTHLRDKVSSGDRYFKSSHIGADLDLSAKEVGANLVYISRDVEDLEIKTWAQSSKARTWLVEPSE